MELHPHICINARGKLVIGGVEATKLVRKYGTPLYVYSEDAIVQRIREYTDSLAAYDCETKVAYAGKAYLTLRMAQLIHQQGLWIDVASGGELFIVLKSGFPPENIIFHGNNKSFDELDMAVSSGVGRIVIDNLEEINRLAAITSQRKVSQPVLIRVTPGIDAHTHKALATGEIDSKFGVPMHQEQHIKACELVLGASHLELMGFHCHIGSQVHEPGPYVLAVKTMLNFIYEVKERTGTLCRELNLGGGLGVSYGPDEKEMTSRELLDHIVSCFMDECQNLAIQKPVLFFEPGRSLVAQSAVTLYRIGTVKELPNGVMVAAVDGGMSDNPRPMLYGARYQAFLANRQADTNDRPVRIVGKHCEEGDTLIEEAWLPQLRSGDILALPVSGAYQYCMSSNYNSLPRPGVLHVVNGDVLEVVRRQTYEDLIAGQRLIHSVKKADGKRVMGKRR